MSTSLPPPPPAGSALPPPAAAPWSQIPVPPPFAGPLAGPATAATGLDRPFRSGRGLATVVRILLLVAIVVTGFDAAANVDAAQLLGRLQADADAVSLAQAEASDLRVGGAALLQVAVTLTAIGFLIAWTSRLYRNLRALGVSPLRYGEGWAIGAWFIPIFNLIRPKQILNDIWRGSGPPDYDGDDWRQRSVTPLLHWWWGLWIAGGVLSWGSLNDSADIGEARDAAIRAVVGDVLFVAAAVLAVIVVTRMTDRQERTAGRLDAGRGSQWVPLALLSPLVSIAAFGFGIAVFAAVDDDATAAGPATSSPERPTSEPSTSAPDGERRTIVVRNLQEGDCVQDDPLEPATSDEVVTVLAVDVVSCATPHAAEVIARLEHPAGPGVEYPGDAAMIDHSDAACLEAFAPSVGVPYDESILILSYIWPEDRAWAEGDRAIHCLVTRPDGRPLTGSVRGTGI